LVFRIGKIEFSNSRKHCFHFNSVPYTITEFQVPKTL